MNSLDVIKLSFLIGLGLSIIYCILTQCFPKIMNKAAVIGALIVILAFAILVVLYSTNSVFKYVVAIILALLFIALLANFLKYRKTFELQGIFLTAASNMLKKRLLTFAYIPLFILILVAFILILVLEFSAFWAGGNIQFDA